MLLDQQYPELERCIERRRFLKALAAGAVVTALGGGTYVVAAADDPRGRALRPDGRPRLPPGQRILDALRPMGGDPGDPNPAAFRLRVHGEVDNPLEIDFAGLLAMPQVDQTCDVHCVTGWTVLDSKWRGVQVAHLARVAKVRDAARHVIFEAAQGYTANVRIAEALAPNVLVAHQLAGNPLPRPHGPPARSLVPDLYFWKSAKWLTGIRFVVADKPGYWETRGYHNHADPWKEERYA
ncbi:MAG: molybdopterin-dependent oxidoreductase [Polyangiaceae bacterium]|nr:molybdopterin-dependent oxidoreductase [Polyangiaceae bacterium]